MVSPTDLDIFARALGGDRRARTELYKKFVRDNSRVNRLGAGCPDRNDFLHDCFNNLLRTGRSWDKQDSLSRWVESVAVWTALQDQRHRDMVARGAKGSIRMCAEIEGEDATQKEVLSAYAPPLLDGGDSPAVRLLALLNEAERLVFSKRAMENGTWEETAAAAGKPQNAVGPIFARVVARLARLFGTPPPVDDDLIPVFARAAADPQKPEGRAISSQLDPLFYTIAPEMQRIGIATSHDARVLALWDTAASATPPGDALRRHLDQCHYCTDLLRALILMQQALVCDVAVEGVEFHLCPGSFTLADAPDMVREAFDQHLARCPVCRAERTQVLDGQAPQQAGEGADDDSRAGAGKKILWTSAAVLLLGVASFAGYRYANVRKVDAAKTQPPVQTGGNLTPTVSIDRRYKDLVQNVALDETRVMAGVPPEHRSAMKFALDQFSLNQFSQALMISSQLAAKGTDTGAQMLYAMSLYRSLLMTDGYREMLKAEAMSPRDTFRCWIMFQFALMVGDRKIIDREAEHLSADPTYKDRVAKVMDRVRERG